MTEEAIRWNRFIEEICSKDMATLSKVQRFAVLCFWYDAEMNSGGYSGYRDCFPDTDPDELAEALSIVGSQEIADHYRRAVAEGAHDDWVATDLAYGACSPSLCEYLQAYVGSNRDILFD